MNKAVCILGIVVMVAKGTLTPSVSVRCRNPQPDFKETVSVNGTTIWPSRRIGLFSGFKIRATYVDACSNHVWATTYRVIVGS